MSTAYLERGVYKDGYSRPGMDRYYDVVRCDECGVALNSGHHYVVGTTFMEEFDSAAPANPHAVALARAHDAEEHR